ncbi:DUF6268 family outer membrane beta-barrel protein [Aquimarina sp. MMG016]|uniref:DUF6268 family outer membrane beta-barrel protein n=1 Tax=Aquimarina sp. MMG016 TaxID=2822690 RepID=UPI001B3A2508|nr:DUF6268 family outer membrane beta-barrel protein [Aquimarina sp. MMG016]MBQ4819429.1 hypothetical protein [Aquimarina sp. MMG016]
MDRHFLHIIFAFGITNILWSQMPEFNNEIAGIEYTTIPGIGETSVQKYQVNAGYRTKLPNGMLSYGLSYTYHEFMYATSTVPFDPYSYENLHVISTNLFYQHTITNSWYINLMMSPTIQSNLEDGISNEDIIINAMITGSKKWGNANNFSILNFGAGYGTQFGRPRIIPVISFRYKINKWNYFIGFPESGITYQPNIRHKVSANAFFNGVFGNISSQVTFPDIGTHTNTKLQYNTLDIGVAYKYRIQPNWTTVIRAGYSPWNELKILDQNNNDIYDFEADSSIFISMGLKFNLNKRKNEKNK